MAGSTYTPIATTTLGSAQTSYTFSSIPGTYTDLVLVCNVKTSTNLSQSVYIQFNSDAGSNYSSTDMLGDGSTATGYRTTGATFIRIMGRATGTANTFHNMCRTSIQNYANTNTFKTLLNRSDVAAGAVGTVGLWRSKSAITSITITAEASTNLETGSTLTLYGILAAQTMANTYTLIASSTVGSGGASSIEFTSIPNTYTDLLLVSNCRGTQAGLANDGKVTVNNSTTGYSSRNLEANSVDATYSQTGGSTGVKIIDVGGNATANTFSSIQIYIPNYTSSNHKCFSIDNVTENNGNNGWKQLGTALWSNTSAITSIKLTPDSGTYVQYSTAQLYGIKNS